MFVSIGGTQSKERLERDRLREEYGEKCGLDRCMRVDSTEEQMFAAGSGLADPITRTLTAAPGGYLPVKNRVKEHLSATVQESNEPVRVLIVQTIPALKKKKT